MFKYMKLSIPSFKIILIDAKYFITCFKIIFMRYLYAETFFELVFIPCQRMIYLMHISGAQSTPI